MENELQWKVQLEKSFKKHNALWDDYECPIDEHIFNKDPLLNFYTKMSWAAVISNFQEALWRAIDHIESPIEKAMLVAIAAYSEKSSHSVKYKLQISEDKYEYFGGNEPSYTRLTIEPQKRFGKYKVDFFLRFSVFEPDFENQRIVDGKKIPGGKYEIRELIVECDGHDFHEKTKEQASKDKKRDIYLQELGFRVYRFTGSDIWKDPYACAETAIGALAHYEKKKNFPAKILIVPDGAA